MKFGELTSEHVGQEVEFANLGVYRRGVLRRVVRRGSKPGRTHVKLDRLGPLSSGVVPNGGTDDETYWVLLIPSPAFPGETDALSLEFMGPMVEVSRV